MSQLFKVSFLEPIKLGDDVYSPGYGFTAPAEQFFGSYFTRELAPLNLFKEGLFAEISRGYYGIFRDILVEVGNVTLRKGDRFYGLPQESSTLGLITFNEDPIGDYVMHVASVSMTSDTYQIEPGKVTTVILTFKDGTDPVAVSGPGLVAIDGKVGQYSFNVTSPMRPGLLSSTVVFTHDGVTYSYPLMMNVKAPTLEFKQINSQMLGGKTEPITFSLKVGGQVPKLTLLSVSANGGVKVGDLVQREDSEYFDLYITPNNSAAKLQITALFDLGEWTQSFLFTVNVVTEDVSTGLVGGGSLDINLTQLVRILIMIGGSPVTNLTTKSLVASGSKSFNTYTKKLVKVDDNGLWQWSVYTNSTEGPMYFDITVTVDGVDYVLPQQTVIVRKGG